MPILEIEGIDSYYGDLQALFGINIKIEAGTVHSVIGSNGAGKSTLLKSIAGSMKIAKGEIRFNGVLVNKLEAHERVRLGISMVPEGRRIFPTLTVEENLKVGGYAKRKGQWNIDSLRDLYPILADRWTRLGSQCSGGELQMVAIARALIANPELLLIDEASLGLAPVVVSQVYASIPKLIGSGTGILLVEQDVNQALKASQSASVLREGKIVLEGASDQLSREAIKQAYFGIESLK